MSQLDRRRFLTRSLTTLGAAGAGAGALALTGGSAAAAPPGADLQKRAMRDGLQELQERVPFDARYQSGILDARPAQATYVALDAVAGNQTELFEALQALSQRARALSQGEAVPVAEVDDPPPDSGILGAYDAPDSTIVNISFGHTLFDGRYGLARHQPRRLARMPQFQLDELDPARTGGDLLLMIAANNRDTVVHTVRELTRTLAGNFTPRWMLDGFTTAQRDPDPHRSTRNLFAFRDGTGNPPVKDTKMMDDLIWVQRGTGEPDFAVGGTYVVVRTIRMHVEFWDRVGMLEQEQMIGRYRVSGAPLGGTGEYEDPDYPSDPKGTRIPLNAHIRLANPRMPQTAEERILRRPYNYNRGFDEAGDQDQGMLFVAFNQDPQRQFAAIRRRLETEPMSDYITPVGGGYFFAPRGAAGPADWVGSGLARA
jgi:deferrochelatase/peroxidase EfeB